MPSSRTTRKKGRGSSKGVGSPHYLFAIPSYERVDTLKNKTLALLERNHIPKSIIYIFVSDEDQKKIYEAELPDYRFIVTNTKGILNKRNFITQYFKEGQKLVQMDDDVEEVMEKVHKDDKTSKVMRPVKLKEFVPAAFKELEKKGLSMWGVNPVNNGYYMYNSVTTDLRYIVGAFRGVINRRDIVLKHSSQKEDVENTIRSYIRDGGVMRYNYITIKTRWYAPGGIVAQESNGDVQDRIKKSKGAVELLAKEFPDYGTPKKRPNGIWEFVLKRNPGGKKSGAGTEEGEDE